jgi:hypothetical protein
MHIEFSKRIYFQKMPGNAMLFVDRLTGQMLWLTETKLLGLIQDGTVRSTDHVPRAAPMPGAEPPK